MSRTKLVTLTLASAMLFTPLAAAGTGGAIPLTAKALRIEQLGPKHLLGVGNSRTRLSSDPTRLLPISNKTLVLEELGPKYLLGGFMLTAALASTAQTGSDVRSGMTPQEWKAIQARSEALNRYYHLGAYSPAAVARRADEREGQAANQYYRLGRYAVIRVPRGFDWADAGIGAGGMLGAFLLAGGLTVAIRRRPRPTRDHTEPLVS